MSTALATMPNGNAIRRKHASMEIVANLRELWDLADILVRSRMLPTSIATPEAAVAIILKGRELGIGAMAAFAGITVIQGKPVVSPQLMLSLINRDGVLEDLQIEDDGHACRVTMKRHGRSSHTATFSMDNAREMGLASKDNWKKMPAIMRQWRAVAACARVVCPDVIDGMYTPEELGAEVNEDGEIVEAEVVEQPRLEAPKTKSAPGLFTDDHIAITDRCNAWISRQCDLANGKWHESWKAHRDSFDDGSVSWPEKIPDVINPWQFKGHLLKWAMDSGRIDPATVPEQTTGRQVDAYVALVYASDKPGIIVEMGDYLAKQRRLKEEAIYRKHPDIAPEGYFPDPAAPVEAEEESQDIAEAPPVTQRKRMSKKELAELSARRLREEQQAKAEATAPLVPDEEDEDPDSHTFPEGRE